MRMIGLILLLSASTATAQTAITPAATSSTVPSVIKMSGGSPRVIIATKINGYPMAMMVHSYASFFAQLRHGQAKSFDVKLTPGTHRNYGIDRNGHVSGLGRDEGTIAALSVGNSVNRDAPVSVFEVPQDRYGMLGTRWIAVNRVVVDFAHSQVIVAPTPAETKARSNALLSNGYVPLKMRYDSVSRFYFVKVAINGVARDMAVTTASNFSIDTGFADAAGLKHGKDVGEGDGPTGTHVPNYELTSPIRLTIDGWTSPTIADGRIFDDYAYIADKRPADPATAIGGSLGGSFLQATGAVIDFGTLTLFVRRQT